MKIKYVLESYSSKTTKYQRDYFANNLESDWPTCKCGCGENVLLNITDSNAIFREYSSPIHSRRSKTISKDVESFLKDYNWIYDQRCTQKKSIELIAKELGISVTPVNKWLKYHNLDGIRYNASDYTIEEMLNDKNHLKSLYDQGMTMEQIATTIGSSKATVSLKFKEHNIPAKKSNLYVRKSNKRSAEEIQLYDWIVSMIPNIEVTHSNKSILEDGRDIDILIPELNIGIEYNGIYSHIYREFESTPSKIKDSTYHLSKTEKCNNKGIQLIHIFSDSWTKKPDTVKTILMSKLGVNKKIFARKCEIRIPTLHEKNIFLNSYHLQGADKSKYYYGLYYNNELVNIMTFGASRYNKKYNWELIRYSGCIGITVVGGFSKLLKHFRKQFEGSIISYADRCYSDGGVYNSNGFTLLRINKPSYYYVDLNKCVRMNRRMFTKKRILKLLNIESSTKSESELIKDMKIEKLFDCGTLTYVME